MQNGFDLFAGAGGLLEGFIQAGFHIIGTVEKEKWACETQKTRQIYHFLRRSGNLDYYWDYCINTLSSDQLHQNRKKIYDKFDGLEGVVDHTVWHAEFGNPANGGNVKTSREIIELLEKSAKFHNKEVDFILGGPPCQAYSLVGRGRIGSKVRNDKRNFLFKYYFNVVKHFRPAFFLFENVPGIVSANGGRIFEFIKQDFDAIGYDLKAGTNPDIRANIQVASDYGVPQNRKRYIFLGVRKDVNLEYPQIEIENFNGNLTTRNAISDLPFLKPNQGIDHGLIYYQNGVDLSGFQRKIRRGSVGVMNHRARPLNKWYDRKIYTTAIEMAEKGEILRYHQLPSELKTHKNQKIFKDRFRVHAWDGMPHTIVAHIAKDGHYNIHPDINQLRAFTVREAARIQSFPDDYKFEGPRTAQFQQVGNAVPPLMAEKIALKIQGMIN
jgi:DNA (cytosine-5)-methyltransferase 1